MHFYIILDSSNQVLATFRDLWSFSNVLCSVPLWSFGRYSVPNYYSLSSVYNIRREKSCKESLFNHRSNFYQIWIRFSLIDCLPSFFLRYFPVSFLTPSFIATIGPPFHRYSASIDHRTIELQFLWSWVCKNLI